MTAARLCPAADRDTPADSVRSSASSIAATIAGAVHPVIPAKQTLIMSRLYAAGRPRRRLPVARGGQRPRAVVAWRAPAAMRTAEVVTLTPIARPVASDHDRGRRVTGSARVPAMHPRPIAAHTAPGPAPGGRPGAVAAVMTAAAGIGHGAATPAPHPASSPAGTDSGTLSPSGWPGS